MKFKFYTNREIISKIKCRTGACGKKRFYLITYILILAIGLNFSLAGAATRNASVSGAWENTATWGGSSIPGSGDVVTINATISVNINSSAQCASLNVIGNLLINSTYNLTISGDFINSGVFTAGPSTSLVFNASSNSIVSGSGTYTVNSIVLNLASKTTVLDVQSANFIEGINDANAFNFTFTRGTWKYNNSASLNNCHDNGNPIALTIPFNVVIESDQGQMNLCYLGTNGNVVLSGKLFINGGDVNVQTGQALNSGYDFRYRVNGVTPPATGPQLYIASGNLHVGGGFNAYSSSDYIDFHMTGGIMTVSDNGYSLASTFLLQDVAGGITFMSGGTIIMQDACNVALADIDMGGANISSYSVTGGTVQFGNPQTQGGSTYFGIQANPTRNYPNFTYDPGIAKSSYPFNIGPDLNMLSLSINSNMTFDSKNANINLLGYNGVTTLNNSGTLIGGTGTWTFSGSTQKISGTSLCTFTNLTINSSVSTTLNSDISIVGNLNIASGSLLDMGTYTANRTASGGILTIAGTLRIAATSGGQSGSNFPLNFATINMTGGTTEYSGASQVIYNGVAYNNLKMANSGGTNTAGGNLTVNGTLTTNAGTTINMGTYTLAGTLTGISNNGIIKSSNTSSTPIPSGKTWGGTVEYSLVTGGQTIVSATSYIHLTLDNSSGTNSCAADLVVNGTLTTTAGGTINMGTYALGGTLTGITNNGVIKTANTGSAAIPTGKTWGGKVEYSAASGAQNVASGTYNDLQLDNTSGTNTANGSLTVNGILNLVNANVACTGNSLTIGSPDILTMGADATTTGNGDVKGKVVRNTFLANKSYSFGSQFTTIIFPNSGTLPSSISVQISFGSAPAWKPGAINREYDLVRVGGSGSLAHLKFHYLSCELNGNTESSLTIFDDTITAGPTNNVRQKGKSNQNMTNHWISLLNIPVESFNTVAGIHLWTLGNNLVSPCRWIGITSIDWTNGTNWDCGHEPTSTDAVLIPTGVPFNPTLAAASTAYTILIETGGLVNGGTGNSLTLSGNSGAWINNGTFNHGSSSTVAFNGRYPTLGGTADFDNMSIAAGTNLTLEEGSDLYLAGNMTNNGIWDVTSTPDNSVTYDGGSQNIVIPNGPLPGYNNLVLAGTGTKTIASGTMNIVNKLTVNSGVTYDGSANNPVVNIEGNFTNNGSAFNQGSGMVTFNGNSNQTIDGSTSSSFNNITVSNTSGAVLVNSNISVNNTYSMTLNSNSVLTPAAGVIISGSGTITGSGRIDVTRTTATADFISQYTIANKTLTNLTVNFVGNSAQTVNSSLNYSNLMISSNGTRTVTFSSGTTGISGSFSPDSTTTTFVNTGNTINFNGAGTQTIPSFNYNNLTFSNTGSRTLSTSGIIGISGTFTPGSNASTVTGSTVSFNGSSSQNIPAFTFNNLTTNNSSGTTLTGNVTTDGILSLLNGSLGIGANQLTLNGGISTGSGSLTGGANSDIIFGGSGSTTTLPAITLRNLTVNRTAGINMGGNTTIGGTLYLTNGPLSIQNSTLTLNGNLTATVNGSLVGDCSSSNIVVGGGGSASNLTLPSVSLKTLTLNRTNGITLGGTGVTICDIFYQQSGNVTLNSNAMTYNSGARLQYDGAYTTTASEWPLANGPYSVIINNTVNYNLANRTLFLNLTINSGKVLNIMPSSGLKVNGNVNNNSGGSSGLVIQSGSAGTGNLIHNNSGVQGRVQRYLTGGTVAKPYHFISSAVNLAPFSSVWQNGDYNVYYYDETVNHVDLDMGWTRILNGSLQNGKGYVVVCAEPTGNKTLSFTGSLNVPPVSVSVTYTNTAGPYSHGGLDPRGWNLIGNPYPCSLDVSQFLNDNSANLNPAAVYYWDDNSGSISRSTDYATRNLIGSTAASGGGMGSPNTKITVGQGFFVKVANTATSIDFNSIERNTNTSNQFFIPDIDGLKRICMSIRGKDSLYNETLIGFLPSATSGYDPLFDAVKLKGNPEISLYTVLDDKDLAIQGLPPVTQETKVLLGIDLKSDGTYVLYAKTIENFTNEHIFLEDRLSGKIVDLEKDTSYTFTSISGSIKNRFYLIITPAKSGNNPDPDNNPSDINIYASKDVLYVKSPINEPLEGKIVVYNVLGKKVYEETLKTGNSQFHLNAKNPTGYYFVTVFTNKATKTRKVFLTAE